MQIYLFWDARNSQGWTLKKTHKSRSGILWSSCVSLPIHCILWLHENWKLAFCNSLQMYVYPYIPYLIPIYNECLFSIEYLHSSTYLLTSCRFCTVMLFKFLFLFHYVFQMFIYLETKKLILWSKKQVGEIASFFKVCKFNRYFWFHSCEV